MSHPVGVLTMSNSSLYSAVRVAESHDIMRHSKLFMQEICKFLIINYLSVTYVFSHDFY